ncbi:IPT/TIG domain-containing protein [Catenuloplanes sp. NPDC051500]|uniref:IPT/TIG domain-containing protein n=1 Tax=Catenuloplanes sp. NPDC051500 TaxID=3363959 RepID=UPI0037AEE3D5
MAGLVVAPPSTAEAAPLEAPPAAEAAAPLDDEDGPVRQRPVGWPGGAERPEGSIWGATRSTPADVDPEPGVASVLTAPTSDAALDLIDIYGGATWPMSPGFAAERYHYHVVTAESALAFESNARAAGATIAATLNGVMLGLSDGDGTLEPVRGANDLVITVTAADAVTTRVYRVTVWRDAAPSPQIIDVGRTTTTVLGGGRSTITVRNAPDMDYCSTPRVIVGENRAEVLENTIDPDTGVNRLLVDLPAATDFTPGTVDLTIRTRCNAFGHSLIGWGTSKNAITYTTSYAVNSIEAPATVTVGTPITVKGPGVTAGASLRYWISDAKGRELDLDWWGYTGEGTTTVYADFPIWQREPWDGDGPRTVHVARCEGGKDASALGGGNDGCQTLLTKAITWKAPVPSNVSISPLGGPLTGGTTLRVRGRFLMCGECAPDLTIGGVTASLSNIVDGSHYESDDVNVYFNGLDVLEYTVPPSATPGPATVTLTTPVGTSKVATPFTYAAKPSIASITPGTVAASGGSVVTLTGAGFGLSGRPTVIIGGVKSPLVTRVSDTKLTAVVPITLAGPGQVDVQVSSSLGGGISAPAALTLVAPGTLPVISGISPASGASGDEITISGTAFGPSGTVGVSIGGVWARVVSSTPASIVVEIPAVGGPGPTDVVVGAVTGLRTSAGGLTVLPDKGIASVFPATVPSYAIGGAATVTITGGGFGAGGTVKVGSANAVAYSSTNSGTTISGVAVPTTTAGPLTVTVTPAGSATSFKSTVRVTAPAISYFGADPYDDVYRNADESVEDSGGVLTVPVAGGTRVRVQGTGFGSSGTLKVGSATVTPTGWSDTLITFAAPAQTAGPAQAVITPAGSPLAATRDGALQYIGALARPAITRIVAAPALDHPAANMFLPGSDPTNTFTLSGTNLTGATAVRVYPSTDANGEPVTSTPGSVTATSLTFSAPRTITDPGWKRVEVVTPGGTVAREQGLEYLDEGITVAASPFHGFCMQSAAVGSGGVPLTPASVTVSNSGGVFGSATGTVTVDGTAVTPVSWNPSEIVFSMSSLASPLSNPWGSKIIKVDPADDGLADRLVGFTCAITPTVATTINGSVNPLTVPVGTTYTAGYTTAGFYGPNPFTATSPAGYEYSSDAGFNNTIRSGLPVAAGDWYVRVNRTAASYATDRYLWTQNPEPVHLTITGTPITVTPKVVGSATLTYKGQLQPSDFTYTPSSTTDPITAVTWEHRNSTCEGQGPDNGWETGLPKNVAWGECGADNAVKASWDVRVKSFEMKTSGTDRAIFYTATRPSTRITINPRNLTITAARADKVYDGTATANPGEPVFSGAISGDDVGIDSGSGGATYPDPSPGTNRAVTLANDLTLTGGTARNYTLTNPRPTFKGTITKAGAMLTLSVSPPSVLISQNPQATITATVTDTRGGAPVDGAGLAPVVLVSLTPSVCTISGTTVTGVSGGACVIQGTQAASANYTAAVAATDPAGTTETIEFPVFAAPQAISVIADDLTIAQGDALSPTAQVAGLFEGDSVSGLDYEYYDGQLLLNTPPTAPGRYRVVPVAGALNDEAIGASYSNPGSFVYVGGTLLITPVPPTITDVSPNYTYIPQSAGVTITGTLLGNVTAVRFGDRTLRSPDFLVNEEGTRLTFTAPASNVAATVPITLVAGTAEATATFSYIPEPVVVTPEPPTPVDPVTPSPSPVTPKPSVIPSIDQDPVIVPSPTTSATPAPGPSTTPSPIGTPSPNPNPTGSPAPTVAPAPTTTVPAEPVRLNLDLNLAVDTKLVGAKAQLTGGGLQPASDYVLQMRSDPVTIASGKTDANGDFTAIITMPGKACVSSGLHQLILTGTAPNGTTVNDTNWITLNDTCTATSITTTKPVGNTVTMRSFIFPYNSAKLRPNAKTVLRNLAGSLKTAKVITITGYTQTDRTSKAAIRANRKLAKQRANAVRKYLRSLGVNVTIVTVGKGPVDPVDHKNQKRNRRVVISAQY